VIVATAAQTGEARRPWRASRRRIAAIAIGIAILATAALAALVASGRRPDWLFRASLDPRLDAIRVGIQIWRDHPMTGVGPGGYALLYPLYSGRNPLLTVHAHNGYVQAGVEMGLFGVAVVAVGAIAAARTLMSAIRSADERDRLLALAVMAGGIAFLVQSLGDATFEFKSVPAALAAMLALGCRARNDDTAPAAVRRSEISALTVLPLLLVLPLAAAFFDLAQKSYAVAVARADAGDWTSAAVYLDTAIRQDPHNALYSFQAGLAEAMAAGSGSPDEHLQRARAHFERGLALEPHSVIGWANYGRVLQQLGDRARARDALVRARTLGNQDVAAQLVAGTALEAMGYGNDALDAYVRALVLDSERISAPFWTATPFRLEHRRDIIERVTAERPLLPVANPAFDLTRTEPVDPRLRTRLDADLRRAQQLILAGELDRAREIIDGHLARRPDDAGALALRGDLLARAGDMEAARQAWFAAGQLGDIQALRTLGDAFDGPVPAGVSGRLEAALIRSSQVVVLDGTQFYWIGIQYYRAVFLRASPRVMLLPGEWEQVQPRPVLDAAEALTRWSAR
jgi:tetratricopeptide (TPR) repeat protein